MIHDPKEFYVQKYHSIRSFLSLQYWTYHLFVSKGFAQNGYTRSYAIYTNRIPTSGNLWQPLARLAGTGKRAPHAPKTCNLTWDDHRNPLRPKIQLGGAPRSFARTCQRLPEVAGAGARGRQSSNAFKAKVFAQSLRKACLAKIPIQA